MNKKSGIVLAVIAIVAIALGTIVASKAIFGDSKIGLPGEEGTEKTLNIQESNNTAHVQQSNQTAKGQVSGNSESSESGP
jgi:hypothetical protein